MPSTNAALARAGYTTAPSHAYGCKLILRDGHPVGHHDAATAWDLPGMREAGAGLSAEQHDALSTRRIAADTYADAYGARRPTDVVVSCDHLFAQWADRLALVATLPPPARAAALAEVDRHSGHPALPQPWPAPLPPVSVALASRRALFGPHEG